MYLSVRREYHVPVRTIIIAGFRIRTSRIVNLARDKVTGKSLLLKMPQRTALSPPPTSTHATTEDNPYSPWRRFQQTITSCSWDEATWPVWYAILVIVTFRP